MSSRSQIVQSVDGGVLTELNVREGDKVAAGDLLAVLDPARMQASADEIVAKTLSLKAVMQRLEAEIGDRPLKFSEELRRHPQIIRSETRLYERRRQALDEELASIEAGLALATQELEALQRLAATGDASSTEVLRSRRQVTEMQASLTNRRNRGVDSRPMSSSTPMTTPSTVASRVRWSTSAPTPWKTARQAAKKSPPTASMSKSTPRIRGGGRPEPMKSRSFPA